MIPFPIIIGGFTVPDPVWFIETPNDNSVDVRTLDASLYTDFIDYYRTWSISWDQISGDDWNTLMGLYVSQFQNEAYLTFEVPVLGINTVAKLDMGQKFVTWAGQQVGDGTQQYYPTVTLQEQSPIS